MATASKSAETCPNGEAREAIGDGTNVGGEEGKSGMRKASFSPPSSLSLFLSLSLLLALSKSSGNTLDAQRCARI